jgi:hypothetical protein
MAQSAGFPPPRILNTSCINMAEEWKSWAQRFDIYCVASETNKKPEDVQVARFLSCIGEDALNIFNTFGLSDGDKKKMAVVRKKFDEYFTPRRNVVFERFQFWKHVQQPGESIDAFVTTLRLRARTCEFGDQEESLIRDRLVISCPDARLQERLLRENEESLAKVVDICRAAETSQQQLKAIKTGVDMASSSSVSAVTNANNKILVCGNCGYAHAPRTCPAFGKTCSSCGRDNHFASVCRSTNKPATQQFRQQKGSYRYPSQYSSRGQGKQTNKSSVHTVEVDDDQYDSLYDSLYVGQLSIDSVDNFDCARGTSWWKVLDINDSSVDCKLDSGAEANVMSLQTYRTLGTSSSMKPTASTLLAYNNTRIKPLGVASLTVKWKGVSHQLTFYIVSHDAATILGLPSCCQLDIIRRVDAISSSPTPASQSTTDLLTEFAEVFTGLGRFPGQYHIVLADNAVPVIHPPRRVPLALQPKLKEALDAMERNGIIVKRDEPTDWVNSLLVVEKKNKTLRLCLDPRDLNRYIKREHYLIPTCDDVITHFHGKRIFTVIDMKDSFWQVALDEPSSLLCTFNSPFGRYSFRRLPFGISCAPEVLQKWNMQLFGDIPGVYVVFDDIIVAANNEAEHDATLRVVLERARKHDVRFNKDKLQYKVPQVKYVGHIVSGQGLSPDPEKVQAIVNMPTPTCAEGLSRFIGMGNWLSKFIPNFSSVTQPLRQLLQDDVTWAWSAVHDEAVRRVKELVSTAPVLRFFNPSSPAIIQTDASSTGLGSCLMQDGHPVAFASRALTDAETRYAQIEKELLAIVFACNKFSNLIYGRHTLIHSDHKPLEQIFKKSISQTTPRLQRMLLCLLKFDLEVAYKPGKEMYVSDTLSRAYTTTTQTTAEIELAEEIDVTVHTLLHDTDISLCTLVDLKAATDDDPTLSRLRDLIRHGFPSDVSALPSNLRCYHSIVANVYEVDGVLLHEGKVLVPDALKPRMLAWIHEGHLGQEKCKALARDSVFWIGMSKDIDDYIQKCSVCLSHRNKQAREPLIPHEVPSRPWQKVGADIFSLYGKDYLLVVDYYSKYPEVNLLSGKTAASVIVHLKSIFSRHGIPEEIVADNMPFNSLEMRRFAGEWNCHIVTSSPHFAQSNGQAERCIQTVKLLLKKAEESGADPYIALLQYRTSPISGLSYSPAQLLFGRALRTKLPAVAANLEPSSISPRPELVLRQQHQKELYDQHARELPELQPGDIVRVRHNEQWMPGVVQSKHSAPRSYVVGTSAGSVLRRNRRDLLKTREDTVTPSPYVEDDVSGSSRAIPAVAASASSTSSSAAQSSTSTTSVTSPTTTASSAPRVTTGSVPHLTGSGRTVKTPVRFNDYCT